MARVNGKETALVLVLAMLAAAVAVPEHAVILMYHHVATGTPAATSTRPAQFAAHLDLLERRGAAVLPLAEVMAALADPDLALADGTVALTFDDGYVSVHAEAFPRLRERGWPFTVFVSPDAIDRREGPVCSWDQLREMAAAGGTIGLHGAKHEHLQRLAPGEDEAAWRRRTRDELAAGLRRLEEEIGPVPPLFAYPYGEWSPALADIVQDLGLIAFGQQSGPVGAGDDRRAVPRFPAAGVYADPEALAEKLRTLPLPLAAVEPADPRLDGGAPRRPAFVLRLAEAPPGLGPARAFDGAVVAPVPLVDGVLEVAPGPRLGPGRARTNVTASSAWPGRWYWYSHLWIVGQEHDD